MQDSKGVYSWTRNWVRGTLAACTESTLCAGAATAGAAVAGGLAIRGVRALAAAGGGAAAATGAIAIPEGQAALAVVHGGKVIAWTGDVALSHAAWVQRALGALPDGATVVTVGTLAGKLVATYSRTYHGNQAAVSEGIMTALRTIFR